MCLEICCFLVDHVQAPLVIVPPAIFPNIQEIQ